jgi:hypothetical protein
MGKAISRAVGVAAIWGAVAVVAMYAPERAPPPRYPAVLRLTALKSGRPASSLQPSI